MMANTARARLCPRIFVAAALLLCPGGPLRAEGETPGMAAPPRTIADITAILDQERPDPAKGAQRTPAMNAEPPAGLADAALAQFYAGRNSAASALRRLA